VRSGRYPPLEQRQQRSDAKIDMDRQQIGHAAEDAAVAFLESQGLEILFRNFRCRTGELDIVARQSDKLIIVEVRTRSGDQFGGAAASVDFRKQVKLRRAAAFLLLQRKDLAALPVRFDVVAIGPAGIEWIKHAFT
jgi:putative endonuclease